MSRKTIDVTITEGRDAGKIYVLTEWQATKAEKWAMRAFSGMIRGGLDIPPGIQEQGVLGLSRLGIIGFAKMAWSDAEPLIDEIMGCIKIVPDPERPQISRALVESDIEDVTTRLTLRKEVLKLHLDFFLTESQ
jgi:hypothetical protein